MNIIEIIIKKRNKQILTEAEINYFIKEYSKDNLQDYQISSLLMAIFLNGMNEDETYYLTKAIVESGVILDLSEIKGITADKHSTGGVGDKTTLVLIPLLASVGVKMAKMSGRGLGHTGGTLDKLEAIDGFKVELTSKQFIDQVNDIGASIISQSDELAIADKKLYALRDVTGTVASIPLIVSSIMSKKIAVNSDIICLDVKIGDGAFFKDLKTAKLAADLMIKTGARFNKKVRAIISTMDEPLGKAIGNKTEVLEAIDTLKGNGPKDLTNVSLTLAKLIVEESDLIASEKIEDILTEKLQNGEAYDKFVEIVHAQGGSLDNFELRYEPQVIKATNTGYVKQIHTEELGKITSMLGGGRITKDDEIDYDVGIMIEKKIGDYIELNEPVFTVYAKSKLSKKDKEKIFNTLVVSENKTEKIKDILAII